MDEIGQSEITDSKKARVVQLESYRKNLGELLPLSKDQLNRLRKWLKDRIDEWKADTGDLHKRLAEDNDLVEGVTYETDYPWDGASNVHCGVPGMYMDIYESVFKRSILGAEIICYAETDEDYLKEILPDIEDAVNYKARNEWNIEDCLEGVFWTTDRDGLGIIQAPWVEEYEKINDVVLVSNEAEFLEEFPDAESAGQTQDEYDELRQTVLSQASVDTPIEIPITFEREKYRGVKGEIVELVDFVTFPAWIPHIKDQGCRGYGKRFSYHRETIRQKGKDEVFYEDAVKDLLKKDGNSRTGEFVKGSDWIQGIKRSNTKDDFELFELVVKGFLDGDNGEEGKYLITYSHDHDILLQCIDYPYRVDFYALFHTDKRPNRLRGKSIPDKTRDSSDEIDTQHNQRINARSVYTIPTFKAHTDLKADPAFDPELKENKFKPGRIFWSAHPEMFDQFKIQPTDLGESIQEETNSLKLLDIRLGSASALLSGGVAPQDPNAPGNKTAIMIQQSNLRMDDPLSELRHGVGDLFDICVSHLYQFGSPQITYQKEGQSLSIPKKVLRRGIKMKMRGITAMQNPEAEMGKKFQLYQMLMAEPSFMQNPDARISLLRDALRSGRIQNREEYLPPKEKVEAQQVEIQKKALIQMELEKAMKAKAEKEAMIQENLNQANQDWRIKNTAERMAESRMGPIPAPMESPAPEGIPVGGAL